MENLNEDMLEVVNKTLKNTDKVLDNMISIQKRQNRTIFLAFIIIGIIVGFFTVTNIIRDTTISKHYFKQNYSQSIDADNTKIRQEIGGN